MKISIFHIIFLLVFSLFTTGSVAATKHAILIGIGNYKDPSWEKINGDRDIPLIKNMLCEFGYQDIVTLVNEQATKMNILKSFKKLIDRCNKGDIVYIHFSGHGQRMTDTDGDETDDQWDETWIPYDAFMQYGPQDRGEKHLSDDEIGRWMTHLHQVTGNKGNIIVVVDACHSGDSSRTSEEIPIRGVQCFFIIPGKHHQKTPKLPEYWLTLSACKHFQQNCEIKTNDGHYGMLSYALHQLSHQWKDKSNTEIMNLLTHFVDNHRGALPQTPILTGDKEKYQVTKIFFN